MRVKKSTPHHYAKEDTKRVNREVLSYELLPLDDTETESRNSAKGGSSLRKKLIIAACVILVLALSVAVYFGGVSAGGCSSESADGAFPVEISGSGVTDGNFRTLGDNICYASDSSFVVLDRHGRQLFSSQLSFSSPVMATDNKSNAIVYDLGAKGFSVFDSEKCLYSAQADNKIFLADVVSGKGYALVTDISGYNSKLSVFGADNKPVYEYSFSEYYISSMALNSDLTGAVLCGLTAEDGEEKSAVYVLDFTQEEPVAYHEVNGDILFDCEYLNSGSVCAVGSNACYICNGSFYGTLCTVSFNQMKLSAYSVNPSTGCAAFSVSRSGDTRNCSIMYVNASAALENTIETDLKIEYLSMYKDTIAVSDKSSVYLYKSNAEQKSQKELPADSKSIRLLSSDAVYVLGLKEINAMYP